MEELQRKLCPKKKKIPYSRFIFDYEITKIQVGKYQTFKGNVRNLREYREINWENFKVNVGRNFRKI